MNFQEFGEKLTELMAKRTGLPLKNLREVFSFSTEEAIDKNRYYRIRCDTARFTDSEPTIALDEEGGIPIGRMGEALIQSDEDNVFFAGTLYFLFQRIIVGTDFTALEHERPQGSPFFPSRPPSSPTVSKTLFENIDLDAALTLLEPRITADNILLENAKFISATEASQARITLPQEQDYMLSQISAYVEDLPSDFLHFSTSQLTNEDISLYQLVGRKKLNPQGSFKFRDIGLISIQALQEEGDIEEDGIEESKTNMQILSNALKKLLPDFTYEIVDDQRGNPELVILAYDSTDAISAVYGLVTERMPMFRAELKKQQRELGGDGTGTSRGGPGA